MLKKTISFSFILLLLFFAYQFLFNSVKSSHSVTYKIGENDIIFDIKEDYVKKDEEYYIFYITKDDMSFIYKIDNYFNKQKEVIKNIEVFESNGYYCTFLEFIDNKHYSFPECNKDGQIYSYNALKNNIDFSKYLQQIDNPNYSNYSKESEKINESNALLNKDYFDDNEVLIMYNYRQVYFIHKQFSRSLDFSNVDNYKNTYGHLVGNYYVIPKITTKSTIELYYIYDIVDGVKSEILLNKPLSKQTYINGVYNDKLYLFDKSELTQYSIDPQNNKIDIIGDKENNAFVITNGEEKNVSVYDLNKENIYFSDNTDLYKSIDFDNIYIADNSAVYEKNGNYYKVYKDYLDNPIFLLSDQTLKNIIYKNNNLYYIKNENIYKMNEFGNFILASKNELNYNYDNIFDIYFK